MDRFYVWILNFMQFHLLGEKMQVPLPRSNWCPFFWGHPVLIPINIMRSKRIKLQALEIITGTQFLLQY